MRIFAFRLPVPRGFLVLLAGIGIGWLLSNLTHYLLVWYDNNVTHCSDSAPLDRPSVSFNNFGSAYAWQRERQNQSLYYFERPGRLIPMMRLTAEETDRRYRVAVTTEWLRTQSIVIAATVRNALPGLESGLKNLDRFRKLFGKSWMVFVENNSGDKTRERLVQLAHSDPTVTVLGCGAVNWGHECKFEVLYGSGRPHGAGQTVKRTMDDEVDRGLIMSAMRNQYLSFIYNHLADKGDLLLMIDPDVEWKDWELENITQGLYYFKTRPRLQQLCANTIDVPSDKLFDPCSLAFYNNKRFGEDTNYPSVDYYKSIHGKTNGLPPVKVESCFQAFAFYRVSELSRAPLWYERSHGEWMCEHNTLSRQLQEVFIDPQMAMGVLAANIG